MAAENRITEAEKRTPPSIISSWKKAYTSACPTGLSVFRCYGIVDPKILTILKIISASGAKRRLTPARNVSPGVKSVLAPAQKVSPGVKNVLTPARKVSPGVKSVLTPARKVSPDVKSLLAPALNVSPGVKSVLAPAPKVLPGAKRRFAPGAKRIQYEISAFALFPDTNAVLALVFRPFPDMRALGPHTRSPLVSCHDIGLKPSC
jgi:hypothetical protein